MTVCPVCPIFCCTPSFCCTELCTGNLACDPQSAPFAPRLYFLSTASLQARLEASTLTFSPSRPPPHVPQHLREEPRSPRLKLVRRKLVPTSPQARLEEVHTHHKAKRTSILNRLPHGANPLDIHCTKAYMYAQRRTGTHTGLGLQVRARRKSNNTIWLSEHDGRA